MREEFKIRNNRSWSGLLIGNNNSNVCFYIKGWFEDITVKIKDTKNLDMGNISKMYDELVDDGFKFLGSVQTKGGWVAARMEDINGIAERLADGKYQVYTDGNLTFVLVKVR